MDNFPVRKHPRLKEYNYSRQGYYFITINACDNKPILSSVGRGLAPADTEIALTPIGKVAENQLFALETRYDYAKIDKYVIMPTHIHAIIILTQETAGASPRPTLCDIICAYKSLVTRICNKNDNKQGRRIFQSSFYEKIIRNESGYLEVCKYIAENPLKVNETDEKYSKHTQK